MSKKSITITLFLSFFLCGRFASCTAEETWSRLLPAGEFYTLYDEDQNLLLETGHQIHLKDQYLSGDNRLFEVVHVDEEKKVATANFVEEIELKIFSWTDIQEELGLSVIEAASKEQKRGKIALYHTHNAESYMPTDGSDSINGKGGVHKVGTVFSEALSNMGIEVLYSERLHLPHDRGAYRRSRETVLELLSKNPDAIFDLHRDAAPKSAYAIQLGDEWMTSIQFVVGRQNQNLGINRKYAQSLKKIADDLYPGLIKGIFYGKGNYNQDLTPLSLLLEVGAHTNSRDAAERGISLFAEVVDYYFYGPSAEASGVGQSKVARRSIFGLVIFITSGTIVFYIINVGGFKSAWKRLSTSLSRLKVK